MINVNDEKLLEIVEDAVRQKKDEIRSLNDAYQSVLNYKKWVIPAEGIQSTSINFDPSLLNKVYIGNAMVSKNALLALLNMFGPVATTFLNSKECVFADFDNPHGAYLCMTEINGMILEGRMLKAGRTSTFPPVIPKELRNPDKSLIYVSNIDEQVEEEQLKEIFGNIGNVEDARLVYNASFIHRGYGYIKFGEQQDARRALAYSNKISLYGRKIRIGPTVVSMVLPKKNNFNIPDEIFVIKARIESAIFGRGRMVILRNLIEIDDADEDFDQEIDGEMRKYGEVVRFGITKEKEVVVYCLYSSDDAAKHSFSILNGRFFGGRRIQAEISDKDFPTGLGRPETV